jgi:CPA1 family monovalent cation:H+ antiporter
MSVVGLLFVAAVSAVVTQRIRFPYTVGLVVIGVAVAFFADDYPDLAHALDTLKLEPVMIMFLFIPILIFESAFNMDVPVLMRNLIPSLTLAGPGLLLSTALIGSLIHLLTPLPLESALIFGCLISATDPVAVIALFKDVGAPKRLNTLMEGESVFNDATAIVTFQIILAVIATGLIDAQTVVGGVVDFFLVFFGGLLVGLGFGWLVVQAIPLIGNQPLIHITLTLVSAYGAFIVADHFLNASGIMAVLSAGLTIGYYGFGFVNEQNASAMVFCMILGS